MAAVLKKSDFEGPNMAVREGGGRVEGGERESLGVWGKERLNV